MSAATRRYSSAAPEPPAARTIILSRPWAFREAKAAVYPAAVVVNSASAKCPPLSLMTATWMVFAGSCPHAPLCRWAAQTDGVFSAFARRRRSALWRASAALRASGSSAV